MKFRSENLLENGNKNQTYHGAELGAPGDEYNKSPYGEGS